MIKKLRFHYQQWKRWQKYCLNSRFHKIMVLLGLRRSPTLEAMKAIEKVSGNITNVFGEFSKSLNETATAFAEFGKIVRATIEKGENDEK